MSNQTSAPTDRKTNSELILPYLAPYVLYIALQSALEEKLPGSWIYALRISSVPILLAIFRRDYLPLSSPSARAGSVAWGIVAGILGTILWITLVAPFADPQAQAWEQAEFLLKLVSVSLIVPLFEELLMRGLFFRAAYQWGEARKAGTPQPLAFVLDKACINEVPPGAWNLPAVIISTAAFTAGHLLYQWPAAIAYSLLMIFLWRTRKDLLSILTAHATTNFILMLYIQQTDQWGLW